MFEPNPQIAWQEFSPLSQQHLELQLKRLAITLGIDENKEALPQLERAASRLEVAEHQSKEVKARLPLLRLAQQFGLDELDCELLLLAIAPAVSEIWRESLESSTRYGKLDVATAVRLLSARGLSPLQALQRFENDAPLRCHQLLHVFSVGRAERSQLLSHRLQAPLRVAHYLLGRRCLDDALNAFARLVLPNNALDELILDPSMVDAL
ncbi:MAG: hypothetical protein RBU37_23355, partial [Myxococcota bacterium]|nr:hypothetical protein [Myxococcota bacterium]